MAVTLKVELVPFTVPNFVRQAMPPRPRQEGFREAPCFALRDLDDETLERMCKDFRDAVFAKARAPRDDS